MIFNIADLLKSKNGFPKCLRIAR